MWPLHSTWQASSRRRRRSLDVSICDLLLNRNWSFHGAVRKTFGCRAFSVASPSVWNALPDSLRDPELTLDVSGVIWRLTSSRYIKCIALEIFLVMRYINVRFTYLLTSCGLRLSDDAVRVAVTLRLGCWVSVAHSCWKCGTLADAQGLHGLVSKKNSSKALDPWAVSSCEFRDRLSIFATYMPLKEFVYRASPFPSRSDETHSRHASSLQTFFQITCNA